MNSGLNTRLLSSVSRSFYLSLRFLPVSFRRGIATGYLLARATDTIADTAKSSGEHRENILREIAGVLHLKNRTEKEKKLVDKLRSELAPYQDHAGERELLERFDEVLVMHHDLPVEEKKLIVEVMEKILKGQILDLRRFDFKVPPAEIIEREGIRCLPDEKSLEEYTYLVAGSVGEFWTKLGFEVFGDSFSRSGREELLIKGRCYGQSLQLINILRDCEEDAGRGRSYLPSQNTGAYIFRAYEGLKEGFSYAESLRGKRLRFATGLPALIGWETLVLLESRSSNGPVKVTRAEIYALIWQGLLAAFTGGGWTDLERAGELNRKTKACGKQSHARS